MKKNLVSGRHLNYSLIFLTKLYCENDVKQTRFVGGGALNGYSMSHGSYSPARKNKRYLGFSSTAQTKGRDENVSPETSTVDHRPRGH